MFSQVSAEVAKPSTAKEEEEKILLLVGTPSAKSFCQCWHYSVNFFSPLIHISTAPPQFCCWTSLLHNSISQFNPYPTLWSFKTSLFLLAAVELQRSHRRGADRPAGGSISLTMTLTLIRTLTMTLTLIRTLTLTLTLTLAKRIMTTNSRLTCLDTCSQVRLQEIWRDRREELSVGLGRIEQVICSNLINIANINNG